MKKTSIMLQTFLIIIFPFIYSCNGENQKKATSKDFLNHTIIKKEDYTKDSIEVIKELKASLQKQEDFFQNKAYFDSTQLIIDSIIYSPNFNKLAVFVITKNPVYRQLMPDKNYEWYYDATCYLGVRENDSISLSWIGSSFTNSYNRVELSGIMRDSYFTGFATKDTIGLHTYKYNMNDVRFWDCSIWKEVEDKKVKKKEFDEEKRKHPENIYEPKQQNK